MSTELNAARLVKSREIEKNTDQVSLQEKKN